MTIPTLGKYTGMWPGRDRATAPLGEYEAYSGRGRYNRARVGSRLGPLRRSPWRAAATAGYDRRARAVTTLQVLPAGRMTSDCDHPRRRVPEDPRPLQGTNLLKPWYPQA